MNNYSQDKLQNVIGKFSSNFYYISVAWQFFIIGAIHGLGEISPYLRQNFIDIYQSTMGKQISKDDAYKEYEAGYKFGLRCAELDKDLELEKIYRELRRKV